VVAWTDAGAIGAVKEEVPTAKEAVDEFFEDAKARHLGWEAVRNYRNLLEKGLVTWCELKPSTPNSARMG
jgi:hypothetical protein